MNKENTDLSLQLKDMIDDIKTNDVKSKKYIKLIQDLYNWINKDNARLIVYTENEVPEHIREDIRLITKHISDQESILQLTLSKINVPVIGKKILWAAAASLMIILLGGGFFLKKYGTEESSLHSIANQTAADIAPGTTKAMLTLSDGTQVILDSSKSGVIAQQGSIQVINLTKILSYKSSNTLNDSNEVVYNTISTPRGGQYQLILQDGSKVWLNAASSLKFPVVFKGNNRAVEVKGEAYFEIAPNSKMPFSVQALDEKIDVLGTSFNVSAYPEDDELTTTTLINGSVRVSSGDLSEKLSPGEQANVTSKAIIKKAINTEPVIAWKTGFFSFKNDNIKAVMRQITRWYNVEVEFAGPPITETFFADIPRSSSISAVLSILEGTGGIHFKIFNKKIVVTK